MKKKILLGLALAAMAFTLFANAQGEGATTIPAYDPNKDYVISIGGYGELEIAYKAVFATEDFKSKFPNISFEFQTADFGGHHNRLTTVLAANEATNDIEALEIGYIAKFVDGGGLTDLARPPFDGVTAGQELVDFAMSNAIMVDADGTQHLVAFPVDIAPAVLFYRKSLCDEAGVDMNSLQSWDDLIAAGKKLTKDTDGDGVVDQFCIPHANEVAMMPLNGGKGGWFDENGTPMQPKEKFIGALELVQKVRQAGIDGDLGAWSGPWTQSFADGTVVAITNGAWWGGALKAWVAPDLAGDWRVAPLPGNTYASQGGTYLSIPQQVPAEQKAAAWEIVKYLCTSPVAQLTTFEEIDAFPALTSVYDDPVMSEPVDYFGGQKVREIYADVARNIPVATVSPYDASVLALFGNAVTDVLVNDVSPEDAYNSTLTEIQALVQ